jgi:hypothetical protein
VSLLIVKRSGYDFISNLNNFPGKIEIVSQENESCTLARVVNKLALSRNIVNNFNICTTATKFVKINMDNEVVRIIED